MCPIGVVEDRDGRANTTKMGCFGKNRFYAPAGGIIQKGCRNDSASTGVEESFAQGSAIGHTDANVLYQSRRARAERSTTRGATEGQETAFKTNRRWTRRKRPEAANPHVKQELQCRIALGTWRKTRYRGGARSNTPNDGLS